MSAWECDSQGYYVFFLTGRLRVIHVAREPIVFFSYVSNKNQFPLTSTRRAILYLLTYYYTGPYGNRSICRRNSYDHNLNLLLLLLHSRCAKTSFTCFGYFRHIRSVDIIWKKMRLISKIKAYKLNRRRTLEIIPRTMNPFPRDSPPKSVFLPVTRHL